VQSKRIESLADGIFAIAMTLLILQVQVPQLEQPVTQRALWNALTLQAPHVTGYFVSFILLGCLWVGHHAQFHFIRRVDRVLLWLNILFLACIGFIPFATALLSEYQRQPIACALYALTLVVAAAFLYAQWAYATKGRRLVDHDIDEQVVKYSMFRIRAAFAVYTAAGLFAFVSVPVALALFVLVPVLYLLPSRLDAHLRQ
jgi:uncharacterized membrane protein